LYLINKQEGEVVVLERASKKPFERLKQKTWDFHFWRRSYVGPKEEG